MMRFEARYTYAFDVIVGNDVTVLVLHHDPDRHHTQAHRCIIESLTAPRISTEGVAGQQEASR